MTETAAVPVTHPSENVVAEAAQHYDRYGLAALPVVIADVSDLRCRVRECYDELRPILQHRLQKHDINLPALGTGYRFSRLDPEADESGEVAQVLDAKGIETWGRDVARQCAPWLGQVTGYDLTHSRSMLIIYEEGDYIGPHGDAYVGHRVNFQFPFNFATRGAMRVLKDGYLEPMYDTEGAPRALGPRMWHEVPPVLRMDPDQPPLRITLSLRFDAFPRDPARRYRGQVAG